MVNSQQNKGLPLKSLQQKQTKSQVLAKENQRMSDSYAKAWRQQTHHLLHYSILHQTLQTTEAVWASFGSSQSLWDLCHTQTIFSWACNWVRSSDTMPRWAGRRWLGGLGGFWAPQPSDPPFCAGVEAGFSNPQLVSSMRKSGTGKKVLQTFQTLRLWPWKVPLIFLTRTSSYYSEGRLLRRGIYPLKTRLCTSWAYFFAEDFLRDLRIKYRWWDILGMLFDWGTVCVVYLYNFLILGCFLGWCSQFRTGIFLLRKWKITKCQGFFSSPSEII